MIDDEPESIIIMMPDKVTFTGFVVEDPLRIVTNQHGNKPCFWSDDWVVIEKTEEPSRNSYHYYEWLRNNCVGSYEILFDYGSNGNRRLIGFEREDEAILFKMAL